jgi:internalin A
MTEPARPQWRILGRFAGREPDPERFVDPWNDVGLISYFEEVAKWHGYVRFLGLPHLREDPDQPLAEVFVEPYLSRQPPDADLPPLRWRYGIEPALAAVTALPRLVVLGEPGAGKSTLVSWIAWSLSQPRPNRWRDCLSPLIPLPLVLRELALGPGLTWEGLLDAFLGHPIAARLGGRDRLYDLLERGQGFLLLDGVDEIGSLETRIELRRVVLELSLIFSQCRFLVTSRIVGYEQVPFRHSSEEAEPPTPGEVQQTGGMHGEPWGDLRYVSPLDDEQIEQFARRWYERREAAQGLRAKGANDLLAAIHGSAATLRLARNPNLLTLMALIHRVQRRLPHGRALLFEKITEAYLDSIDSFRGIHDVNYSFAEKKLWLARVAFEMQCRRARGDSQLKGAKVSPRGREILATGEEVGGWILAAMEGTPHGRDPAAADRYLDYIGRRSGLLLPRGHGLFGFTHLSFQEYFAAVYLAEQVISPRWMRGHAAAGTCPEDLQQYSGEELWRETLVLLCELLATRPEWLSEALNSMFGESFAALRQSEAIRWDAPKQPEAMRKARQAELLAEIAGDPYGGLLLERRKLAWKACWQWVWEASEAWQDLPLEMREEGYGLDVVSAVNRRLTATEPEETSDLWSTFAEVAADQQERTALNLAGASIHESMPWHALDRLKDLSLIDTAFEDLSVLSGLSKLNVLALARTAVSDLDGLRQLRRLEELSLSSTRARDGQPLRHLSSLRSLDLSATEVTDLSWLRNLREMEIIYLTDCRVDDLQPLEKLAKLTRLRLDGTLVDDARQLARLRALTYLDLSRTEVRDLAPLRGLRSLLWLRLAFTPASDLNPLSDLEQLVYLKLDETMVSDLSPVRGLRGLRQLRLAGTRVTDLAPLRDLRTLEALFLAQTSVRDVSPLAGLENLRTLDLRGTLVTDLSPLRHLPHLQRLYLLKTKVSAEQLRQLPKQVVVKQ